MIKSLLVAVYVFLFAAQLNGRFYSVANFYVYGDAGTALHAKGPVVKSPVFGTPRSGRTHLSLDKRFYGRDGIRALPGYVDCLVSPDYVLVRVHYYISADRTVRTTPVVRCLRGPPAFACYS